MRTEDILQLFEAEQRAAQQRADRSLNNNPVFANVRNMHGIKVGHIVSSGFSLSDEHTFTWSFFPADKSRRKVVCRPLGEVVPKWCGNFKLDDIETAEDKMDRHEAEREAKRARNFEAVITVRFSTEAELRALLDQAHEQASRAAAGFCLDDVSHTAELFTGPSSDVVTLGEIVTRPLRGDA